MDRFRTTLCLNGVRTSDNTPLHVVDAQTLLLNGRSIHADDVVERALPSRVATAIETSMAAAPSYTTSVFFLLGAQVHHGRLGDAVVNYVVRDQARHRSLVYNRQVSQRAVVTLPSNGAASPQQSPSPLQYEECLLFAYEDGAVACETLRATDTADTVDDVLGSLRVISLAIFKYAAHKTCVLLVGSHLSTAHMAALLCASRRHVFLYVDATMSAHEVEATTAEMEQVRHFLCTFALPLDGDVREARAALAARLHATASSSSSSPPSSRVLDAIAHSAEEYELLLSAVVLENVARDAARTARDEAADQSGRAALQKEVQAAHAAREAAEAELKEQRETHRAEMLALREELRRVEEEQTASHHAASASSASVMSGVGGGGSGSRPVSQNLLHSFQQQSQSHLEASVTQLQQALQDAVKAQKFAEEKARLLELRQSMKAAHTSMAPLAAGEPLAASGTVVSPRPSLRLPSASGSAVYGPLSTDSATAQTAAWEQSLLQQENTALVAEFQRKEKEWQQRLRHASAEVAQLREAKAAMETTLQLQSQTIAAAQQALLDSRAAQEQEMNQVLRRVQTLSQESRSRQRSRGAPSEASTVHTSGGAAAADVMQGKLDHTPPPRMSSGQTNGGMMSPTR